MGGLLHITGQKESPSKVGIAITDICTGLYAHGAILTALYHRAKYGEGQRIEVDLFSTQIACLINAAASYLNASIEGSRHGTEHPSIVPYASFQTRDGFFTIGTGSDDQFVDFCGRLDIGHLCQDTKFSKNSERVKNRVELSEILKNIFLKENNSFWTEKFEGATFPYGPVNSLKGVFEDEHTKHIGIVKSIDHKEAGKVKVVGPNVVYSDLRNEVYLPPPVLGEHTDEILKDILKYSDEKIETLRAKKIVS